MISLDNISIYLFSLVASLIALTVHEYCHGYAAYKLGDPTARNSGRLSLNPLHHIDPVGVLFMVIFHFGWAKPVPINPRYFKKPKRDFAITAIAGPLSNVVLAFISTPIMLLVLLLANRIFTESTGEFAIGLVANLLIFLRYFVVINLGLGIFNLIPVPPFDGSRIVNVLMPERLYFKIMKYEKYIYWGVIAWLFLGQYVYFGLMRIPFVAGNQVLSAFARIFYLSGMISDAINFFYELFVSFWSLIIH